jgi:hypothetical protein
MKQPINKFHDNCRLSEGSLNWRSPHLIFLIILRFLSSISVGLVTCHEFYLLERWTLDLAGWKILKETVNGLG